MDTLQAIHDDHPDAELTLILGADTARTLPGWREPARLLSMAQLAVAERDELDTEDVREALLSSTPTTAPLIAPGAPGSGPAQRVRMLKMSKVAISSSAVRELIAAGRPVIELVGEAVAGYISEHGLYRAAGVSAAGIGGAR